MSGKKIKKLAVIIPGIGYNKDKPLLYYSSKCLRQMGYEIVNVEFHDMPQNILEDDAKKKLAVKLAIQQTAEQLSNLKMNGYDDIIFVGKSLGTIASAQYVSENRLNARQIWLTPVEKTFSFPSENVLAFIGDSDPWSDLAKVRKKAKSLKVHLITIDGGYNHSLECGSVKSDLMIMAYVISVIETFVKGELKEDRA
ncbi:MAG: alpha/beta hydrolase [Lachnospiraceae bacterium]|nr:alpha/beta hydrolase [Lachnospiraceae bacterium]